MMLVKDTPMISFTKNKTALYEINGLPANIKAGCAGRAANNIDYLQDHEGVRFAEKKILSAATGLHEKDILSLEQVHGRDILIVEEKPAAPCAIYGTADAMLTSLKEVCLVIRAADCVPVILADKKSRAVGAVHSGWKGSRLGISGAAAALMKERFGCSGDDLLACILPSIGPQSYEVKEDVAQYFPEYTARRGGSLFVDLWAAVTASLVAEGVPHENIFNCRICNLQNTDEFFSHRHGDTGRNLNYIFITRL